MTQIFVIMNWASILGFKASNSYKEREIIELKLKLLGICLDGEKIHCQGILKNIDDRIILLVWW